MGVGLWEEYGVSCLFLARSRWQGIFVLVWGGWGGVEGKGFKKREVVGRWGGEHVELYQGTMRSVKI